MSILQNSIVQSDDYNAFMARIDKGIIDLTKANSDISSAADGINVAVSVFSVIGTIVIALSVFPQVMKTMKDRNTAGLSFLLFFLTGLATAFLALYGIGLIAVDPKSFNFAVGKFTEGSTKYYVYNYNNYVAGFLVPGIFLLVCETFMFITSFMVAFVKLANQIKAKKAGMSESEYYEIHIKPTLNLKGAK